MRRLPLLFCFMVFMISGLLGQNLVDIRFAPVKHDRLSCYDLEVRAVDREEILLAGQNYRIFYNPSTLSFLKNKVDSYSPRETYDDIRILKKHHSDEISTAMINLGIDAVKYDPSKNIKLGRKEWTKTAHVCFERTNQNAFDLTWAREAKTADLATAYVSLSEWIDNKGQQPLRVNEYIDFYSNERKDLETADLIEVGIYPNPVQRELYLSVSDGKPFDGGTAIITNATGQLIRSERLQNDNTNHTLSLGGLSSGNYFIEIQNVDRETLYRGKFVKSSN